MRKIITATLALLLFACNNANKDYDKIADNILAFYRVQLPEMDSVISWSYSIDTITPAKKMRLQAFEYNTRSEMIKLLANNNMNSEEREQFAIYKKKYDSCMALVPTLDSTTVLFYEAQPEVVFVKKDRMKYTAFSEVFLDKDLSILSRGMLFDVPPASYEINPDHVHVAPYNPAYNQ